MMIIVIENRAAIIAELAVFRLQQQKGGGVWHTQSTDDQTESVSRYSTMRSGRVQSLSATPVSAHLEGSRYNHFYSPLDGRRLFTWREPEFCLSAGYFEGPLRRAADAFWCWEEQWCSIWGGMKRDRYFLLFATTKLCKNFLREFSADCLT